MERSICLVGTHRARVGEELDGSLTSSHMAPNQLYPSTQRASQLRNHSKGLSRKGPQSHSHRYPRGWDTEAIEAWSWGWHGWVAEVRVFQTPHSSPWIGRPLCPAAPQPQTSAAGPPGCALLCESARSSR